MMRIEKKKKRTFMPYNMVRVRVRVRVRLQQHSTLGCEQGCGVLRRGLVGRARVGVFPFGVLNTKHLV